MRTTTPAPHEGRPAAARRPDESMSLLTEAASNPVDPAYAAAAARRAERPGSSRSRPATLLAGLLVAVLATGTVLAARELRAPAPDVLLARSLLEEEIRRRSAEAQTLRDEVERLGVEVEELTAAALSEGDPALREVARLAPTVGTVPVSGPGLSVTLADSPRAATDPTATAERVQYVDLQVLTNGLWQAGAEAIAINGHRLTAVSAIRFAGEAILVEVTPLVGPYRVEAIGDPEGMRTALEQTQAAGHLALLRTTYGIRADVVAERELTLPAAPVPTLRLSRPAGADEADEADETGGPAQPAGPA